MASPVRVAFVGKKKAALTFSGRHLQLKHKFKYMQLEDGVRRVFKVLHNDQPYTRYPWEHRLQVYDALYKVDKNIWIDYLAERLKTTTRDVVINDIRYMNELEIIKDLGFTIVRITAPEKNPKHIKSIMDGSAGLVLLQEWFNRENFTDAAEIKYAIHIADRASARKALDILVETLRGT